MTIKITNHAESKGVEPVKLYTQGEVDDLLDEKEKDHYSRAQVIEKESQIALRQKRQSDKTVAKLVKRSNRILLSLTSHALPFDPFPDVLNIEEGRMTIIDRHFLSSEIHSLDIANISNVLINTTIFRSQLVIISKTFEENEIKLRNLLTHEAVYARRMIEGLRVFVQKGIDTSSYSKKDLIVKLEELSTTEIVT